MKLLHRHLFANVALTCLASVGLFAFVLLLGNALRDLLGYVLAGQLDPVTFLRLLALLVPFVVSYALPMGVLTGVLLVLGRMSSDRELTAIRAAGVSVAGIAAPILFLALLGVAASLAINFEFMPRARIAYKQELAQAVRQNPLSFIVPRTFIRDFPGIVLYVGEKRNDETLRDFWLWEVDALGRVKRFARADVGHLRYDEAANKQKRWLHLPPSEKQMKLLGLDPMAGLGVSRYRAACMLQWRFSERGIKQKILNRGLKVAA